MSKEELKRIILEGNVKDEERTSMDERFNFLCVIHMFEDYQEEGRTDINKLLKEIQNKYSITKK